MVLDFLISTNFCVLYGRNSNSNGFTYISTQGGASVVDYCLTPYEDLAKYEHFSVNRVRTLIQQAIGIENTDCRTIPDHSFLTWKYVFANYVDSRSAGQNSEIVKEVIFTKYDRKNVPSCFLTDDRVVTQLNTAIDKLQSGHRNQTLIDAVYEDFCTIVKTEMDQLLRPKVILLNSTTQRKRKRTKKPILCRYYGTRCVSKNGNG